MKRISLAVFLSLMTTLALGQADKTITNRAVDGDLILEVNDGGVPSSGITIDGSTAEIKIGPTATAGWFGGGSNLLLHSTAGNDVGNAFLDFEDGSTDFEGRILYDFFSAQRTEKIVPESVYRTGETKEGVSDAYAMDYEQLIPVLTKAVQEQQQIIEELKQRLEDAGL